MAWRGEALFSLGRVKAAAASFEAALELHPQDHWVSARLWKAKARLGDWGAVRDTLARWVRDGRSDSDEAWALLGWAEGRLGRAREEARCLSRALKLNSRNPVALLARRVGSRRIDAGAVETLAGLNDPAAHFSTDTMLGYCRRSLSRRCAAALERGELAAALALAESESKGGRDIQAFLFRGWLRLSTGDAQGAVEEASRALDETLDPGCRPALWLRARAAEGLHG
ncbi:MAG: hypothetical protein HY077_16535 [Elusimicrobia bacterium]|nr:hypothetical protein [Elusimicrobiota bacterium]